MDKPPMEPEFGERAVDQWQSSLPKPLRTFSYFFFGLVALVSVFGWIVSPGS
ncbi:hypothetical protein ACFFNY_12875 [Paenibacillus hodogayensis]|uniref:Uncharacterized protein n=1 Tax=Paenibacillus hodogayensis TaxID=279208 RepID=A0ABV5VWK8_9BACL